MPEPAAAETPITDLLGGIVAPDEGGGTPWDTFKNLWEKNKGHHSISGELRTTIDTKIRLGSEHDEEAGKAVLLEEIHDLLEPDKTPLWWGWFPHPFTIELFPIVIRSVIVVVLLTLLLSVNPQSKKKMAIIYGAGSLFIITDLVVVWTGRHGMVDSDGPNFLKWIGLIILTMILVGALVGNQTYFHNSGNKYVVAICIGYIYIYYLMAWVKGCGIPSPWNLMGDDYPWECDTVQLNLSDEEERGIKAKIDEREKNIRDDFKDAAEEAQVDYNKASASTKLKHDEESNAKATAARLSGVKEGLLRSSLYNSMINDKIILNITEPELQKDITLLNKSRDGENVIQAFIYVKLTNNYKRIQFISFKDVDKTYTLTDKGNWTTKTLTDKGEISKWGLRDNENNLVYGGHGTNKRTVSDFGAKIDSRSNFLKFKVEKPAEETSKANMKLWSSGGDSYMEDYQSGHTLHKWKTIHPNGFGEKEATQICNFFGYDGGDHGDMVYSEASHGWQGGVSGLLYIFGGYDNVGSKGGGDHGTAQIKCDDGTCNLSKDVNVDNLRLGLSKKTAPSGGDKAVTLTCSNNADILLEGSSVQEPRIYVRILPTKKISIDFKIKGSSNGDKLRTILDTGWVRINKSKSFKINKL